MKSYIQIVVLLYIFVSFAESAAMLQLVDIGERVEIRIAHEKTKGIARINGKEKAVMYFSGPNAGVFIDSNGTELDSSNYEITEDKTFIIKNVREADLASYLCEPNNGNRLISSNYEITEEGSLIIKRVTEADIGRYMPEPNINANPLLGPSAYDLVLDQQ